MLPSLSLSYPSLPRATPFLVGGPESTTISDFEQISIPMVFAASPQINVLSGSESISSFGLNTLYSRSQLSVVARFGWYNPEYIFSLPACITAHTGRSRFMNGCDSISSVGTDTIGKLLADASDLAKLIPTRSALNPPGPLATNTALRSDILIPVRLSIS